MDIRLKDNLKENICMLTCTFNACCINCYKLPCDIITQWSKIAFIEGKEVEDKWLKCSIARTLKGAGSTSAVAFQHNLKWPANFKKSLLYCKINI